MVASGHTYIIVNKKAGTACDLSGQDQKSVIGFGAKGSENQKWRIQDTGSGWTLQNLENQKYLDVEGPLKDGTQVVAVETGNPRTWDIRAEQNDSDAYRIVLRGSSLNVDLSDHGSSKQGTPVTIWGQWAGENQVWRFQDT